MPVKPVLAATLTVTNTNDGGSGSLRQAIADAAVGDTITFHSSLAGQTIPLNSTLVINKDLTIDGSSLASRITISGNNSVRVFDVSVVGIHVTLNNLRVVNGFISASEGGGLASRGDLNIMNSVFSGNDADEGGAIINIGTLNITDSIFSDNQAISASPAGGGILNFGVLNITNSTFSDNTAVSPLGGDGGAIFNSDTLNVVNSTFSGNIASEGQGGGIDNNSGTASIINSTFSGNSAKYGGGVFNVDMLSITSSTFVSNSGISAGGAINNYDTLTVTNSTFSNNSSGGGFESGQGGGIYNQFAKTMTITNSTFSGNTLLRGGNGGAIRNDGLMNFSNTILANSIAESGVDCAGFGTIGVNSHNLIEVGSECGTPALRSDPMLDVLAHYGGPTQTMKLLTGSPAIDTGDDLICANSYVNNLDQRSVTRPQGSHCDIGAYEAEYLLTISGNTGVGGATLSYIDGTSKSITSDSNGHYSISLPVGWSGVFTPNKTGYTFTPANRTYNNLQSDQTGQNYTIQPTTGGADTTGVFRPSNGALYLKNSNTTGFADVQINYGIGGDYPVVGDWDGNGTATIGIYRNGSFYLRNSNTIGFADVVFPFGAPGDQPVAGDWDGDGVDTIGVYRNGMFFLRNDNSAGATSAIFALGIPGDVGIAGDWNGDGMDTTGVFRPSNGALYLKNQNTTGFADIQINYGIAGDKPVTGDWNDDGVDTIGVYRNGQFMLRNSNTIGFADIVFALGIPGDMPIAGNWDALP